MIALTLLLVNIVSGQRLFDSLKLEKALLFLPETTHIKSDTNIIRAIEAVDKNYRKIADSLYSYNSLKYTIFQNVPIETDDSVFVNPLLLGGRINTRNIIFNNTSLNTRIDSIAKRLSSIERNKLYSYLAKNFDYFSEKSKKFSPKPVRLRYIKFPEKGIAEVGIDIYGTHFLWTINEGLNWDVVKVQQMWIY